MLVVVADLPFPSPCLVVLVGPAGSGKTTWADATFGAGRVVSSDRLRAVVGTGEDDLDASADAFFLLKETVARRLARGLTTVIDTLGFDASSRIDWREMAASVAMPCTCMVFNTPPSVCRTRNAARAKRVPNRVLDQQLTTFASVRQAVATEGFQDVRVIQPAAPSLSASTPESSAAAGSEPEPTQEPKQRLRFGLVLSSFAWPDSLPSRLASIASEAEAAGFDAIWVMDHLRQIPQVGRAWDPLPEAFTLLSWLAACTERVRLGPLVTSVTLRPIGLLAQMIATLDVLSDGRANCGLGAGWYEAEAKALGIPFPPLNQRYAVLEDALQALPVLWGAGTKPFEGQTVHMPEAMCYPRPIQAKIPILVGGGGEKRTLALAARYADACNLRGSNEVIAHKIDVLRQHGATIGRNLDEVDVTVLTDAVLDSPHGPVVERLRPRRIPAERWAAQVGVGTVEQQVARFDGLQEMGVREAMVALPELAADGDPSVVARFGAVIAALRRERRR